MLLLGPSGSGKTNSIGALARAGLNVVLLDVEKRSESIQQDGLTVLTVDTVEDLRDFVRTMSNPAARIQLVGEKPIDILAVDSLMEVANLLDSALRIEYPDKGGDGSYRRWDEYGTRLMAFTKAVCSMASVSAADPVSVLMTCGLQPRLTPLGLTEYDIMLKGKIAPAMLPYAFTYVFRQGATLVDEAVVFTLDTAGPGLKGLQSVLPPRIELSRDGFAAVYAKIMAALAGSVTQAAEQKPPRKEK